MYVRWITVPRFARLRRVRNDGMAFALGFSYILKAKVFLLMSDVI
jgi:hypothetical protein